MMENCTKLGLKDAMEKLCNAQAKDYCVTQLLNDMWIRPRQSIKRV